MKKEERIVRYGEVAYDKMLEQSRERSKKWQEEHREEILAAKKEYYEEHPEQAKANSQEQCKKGGKYYERTLEKEQTGLRGERNLIRKKHAGKWRPFKNLIAPESQLHHEWLPRTAEYRGVALVEKEPHQHGIIDVIRILDGEITLLTEEEVKMGKKR